MSNHKAHPLGGKLVSWPVLVLAPFAVLCGMLILKRLFFGLGSVTDLNGGYPWGLWISFDLLIGTGFAQPNPATSRSRDPSTSRWRSGLRVNRPYWRGVI